MSGSRESTSIGFTPVVRERDAKLALLQLSF
jgi:hypothetical protein